MTNRSASSDWRSFRVNWFLSGLLKVSASAALMTHSAWGSGDGAEACQVAVLRNGFNLTVGRSEVEGLSTRLYMCSDAGSGYMEIPTSQIERFERAEPTPRPAMASAVAVAPPKDSVKNLITNAAARHQIDPDFVASVVKAESGFNPAAVSTKGASGLMQLMPQTAAQLGVGNVFDPAANVEGGTKYLRQLLDRYDGDAVKALAAYNAGPLRVDQYGGVPPYRETVDYVTKIVADYNRKKLEQQALATPPLAGKAADK